MSRRRAEYWLERAEEARTIAEGMKNPEAKLTMLAIVADYLALAAYVESLEESVLRLGDGPTSEG